MNLINIINHYGTILRDGAYSRLGRDKDRVSALVAKILNPVVDAAVHTEPLPQWTNKALICLMILVWAYTIGLSWWADNQTFVISGGLVIASLFVGIFARVENEDRS